MKYILFRPRSFFLLISTVLETKSFTAATEDLLGAGNVLEVRGSIMVPSVQSLAAAETIPSFELCTSAEIIHRDYDENLPGTTRFFSTLS